MIRFSRRMFFDKRLSITCSANQGEPERKPAMASVALPNMLFRSFARLIDDDIIVMPPFIGQ